MFKFNLFGGDERIRSLESRVDDLLKQLEGRVRRPAAKVHRVTVESPETTWELRTYGGGGKALRGRRFFSKCVNDAIKTATSVVRRSRGKASGYKYMLGRLKSNGTYDPTATYKWSCRRGSWVQQTRVVDKQLLLIRGESSN